MRPNSSVSTNSLENSVQAVIQMDIRSLTSSVEDNAPTNTPRYLQSSRRRSSKMRLASVATIRSLFVTCTDLLNHLQQIGKSTSLSQYYACQRSLLDKVLPDSLFAFEYCQEILALKGATDLPVATKLAKVAHSICDHIDLIKGKLNISLEFHELEKNTLAEIRSFASKDDLTLQQISALMHSLKVTLPLRLEAFAHTASTNFPDSVEYLNRIRMSILTKAQKQESLLNKRQYPQLGPNKESNGKLGQLRSTGSPSRPRIRLLRGLKQKQQLSGNHQKILSLKECEGINKPSRKPIDVNKENRSHYHGSITKSKLQSPTRIQNRRISGPIKAIPSNCEKNTRMIEGSRIPRPTDINTIRSRCCSRSSFNGEDISALNCGKKLQMSSPSMTKDSDYSTMMLSSPEVTCLDTPLSRKSSVPILRPRDSIGSLNIPKRRNLVPSRFC